MLTRVRFKTQLLCESSCIHISFKSCMCLFIAANSDSMAISISYCGNLTVPLSTAETFKKFNINCVAMLFRFRKMMEFKSDKPSLKTFPLHVELVN